MFTLDLCDYTVLPIFIELYYLDSEWFDLLLTYIPELTIVFCAYQYHDSENMCFVCESHASVSIAVCFYCHLMLLQFISKWNGIGLAYFTILSLETQIPIMSMHIDLLCDRCTFGTALKLTCFTAGLNNSDMASLWTLEKKTSQYCISNE